MAGIRTFSISTALVCGLASVVSTGERVQAETQTVSAAQSLKGALQDIVPMFEKEYSRTGQVIFGTPLTLPSPHTRAVAILNVRIPAMILLFLTLSLQGLTRRSDT